MEPVSPSHSNKQRGRDNGHSLAMKIELTLFVRTASPPTQFCKREAAACFNAVTFKRIFDILAITDPFKPSRFYSWICLAGSIFDIRGGFRTRASRPQLDPSLSDAKLFLSPQAFFFWIQYGAFARSEYEIVGISGTISAAFRC
jgi:hypothetical protein